jgi:nicotinate-nucleotide pyrophosphorylase (carboxylating)
MRPSLDAPAFHNLLRSFLAEDVGPCDITTETTVASTQRARGDVIAKAPLVLAGIELFAEVFRLLDPAPKVELLSRDGEELPAGKVLARVHASARALLTGERVALNLLQRLSGVATLTRRFVRAIEGTGAEILDTRKTTPGLRALEKYAVRVGAAKATARISAKLSSSRKIIFAWRGAFRRRSRRPKRPKAARRGLKLKSRIWMN